MNGPRIRTADSVRTTIHKLERTAGELEHFLLAYRIHDRIEANHNVTVRGGVVTSEPCVFNYGYGKS